MIDSFSILSIQHTANCQPCGAPVRLKLGRRARDWGMRRPGRERGTSGAGRPRHLRARQDRPTRDPSADRNQSRRIPSSPSNTRSRSPPEDGSRTPGRAADTPSRERPISRRWWVQPRVAGPLSQAARGRQDLLRSQQRPVPGQREVSGSPAIPRTPTCPHCGLAVGNDPVCPFSGRTRVANHRQPASSPSALALTHESEILVYAQGGFGWQSHTSSLYVDAVTTERDTLTPIHLWDARHAAGALPEVRRRLPTPSNSRRNHG